MKLLGGLQKHHLEKRGSHRAGCGSIRVVTCFIVTYLLVLSSPLSNITAVNPAMVDLAVADINGNEEDSRQIETLLIDLDDTLYQVHEAPELVRENIQGLSDPNHLPLQDKELMAHSEAYLGVLQHT